MYMYNVEFYLENLLSMRCFIILFFGSLQIGCQDAGQIFFLM